MTTRKKHHEQALNQMRRDHVHRLASSAITDEDRAKLREKERDYLLAVAGLTDDDLNQDERDWLDWLLDYGDASVLGGVAALVEAALVKDHR